MFSRENSFEDVVALSCLELFASHEALLLEHIFTEVSRLRIEMASRCKAPAISGALPRWIVQFLPALLGQSLSRDTVFTYFPHAPDVSDW